MNQLTIGCRPGKEEVANRTSRSWGRTVFAGFTLMMTSVTHAIVTLDGYYYGHTADDSYIYLPPFPRPDFISPSVRLYLGDALPANLGVTDGSRVHLELLSAYSGSSTPSTIRLTGLGSEIDVGILNQSLNSQMSVTGGAALRAYQATTMDLTIQGTTSRANVSVLNAFGLRLVGGGSLVSGTAYVPAGFALVEGGDSSWMGENLYVGRGGTGRVDVKSGAQLIQGAIVLGEQGGNGSVTVDGSGTLFSGLGSQGRMSVGRSNGTGTLTVRNQAALSGFRLVNVGADGGSGSLDVQSRGTFEAQRLALGLNEGIGSLMLNGQGSTIELRGIDMERLSIGSGGIGTVIVQGGATLDATFNRAACAGRQCGASVGALAGGRANFFVTGPSSASFLGSFVVGATGFSTFEGGVQGAQTVASISVLDGGLLKTEQVFAGGWAHYAGNGQESSLSTVVVAGTNSTWRVAGNETLDAMVSTGTQSRSVSNWSIRDHGALLVIADSISRDAHLRIAHTGGTSSFEIGSASGLPAYLNLVGNVASINVGEGGGEGTLTILRGGGTFVQGVVDSYMNIGMATSSGQVFVKGGTLSGLRHLHVGAGGSGRLVVDNTGLVESDSADVSVPMLPTAAGPAASQVSISGTSSRWLVIGRAGSGGSEAILSTATHPAGQANMDIVDGGALLLQAQPGREAHLRLSHGGGKSSTLVRDPSSHIAVTGTTASVNVGENGGSATLKIANQARVEVLGRAHSYLTVGMPGSTGEVFVQSPGSELLLQVPAVGPGQGMNPQVYVGLGGTGKIEVLQGAAMRVNGQAESTPTYPSFTAMNIGLASSQPGVGTVNVTGPGSSLAVDGNDAGLFVGRGTGGTGTLNVTGGAALRTTLLAVGADGGVGTLTLDAARADLSSQWSSSSLTGALLTVGYGPGARGEATLANGSNLLISNSGPARAGIQLGATGGNSATRASGSLTLREGSTVALDSGIAGGSFAIVGNGGDGRISLMQNSRLKMTDGDLIVAQQQNSTGELSLAEGSMAEARYVGIGVYHGVQGGWGRAMVLGTSMLTTGVLEVGQRGLIGGDGTIEADVDLSGVLAPGRSPGTLTLLGDLSVRPGARLELEVESDGKGGFRVDHLVLANDAALSLSDLTINFHFLGGANPQLFHDQGAFSIDTFLHRYSGNTIDHGLFAGVTFAASADSFHFDTFSFTADGGAIFTLSPVPELSGWLMFLIGLGSLRVHARHRQRRSGT